MKPYVGTEPIKDVLSWNLHRRHLTTSQRAMIATAVLPMLEEQAKERMKEAGAKGAAIAGKGRPAQNDRGWANLPTPEEPEEKHRASDDAAAMLSVSSRAVRAAKKVQQAAPELAEKVKAGEGSLNAAAQEKRNPRPAGASRGRGACAPMPRNYFSRRCRARSMSPSGRA